MNTISDEQVDEAIADLNGLTNQRLTKLIETFQKKQPYLGVYVLAMFEREELNESEQELLFNIVFSCWYILGALAFWLIGVETRGRSFEEIDGTMTASAAAARPAAQASATS